MAVKINPVANGYVRSWLRCRECGSVSYFDFVPYSLSNPVTWTRCGHDQGRRDLNCLEIPESEALVALTQGGIAVCH